jgi:hypothetical protein
MTGIFIRISGTFIAGNCYDVKSRLGWNIFLSAIFKVRKYIDSRIYPS